ncbi:hypothetical protein BV20DRAFT_221982 [Pilatotrama ljubarskyi]|nr:hypothetical protein BV20DRAFT_221982 [Pilatotrama ljubarskyi]
MCSCSFVRSRFIVVRRNASHVISPLRRFASTEGLIADSDAHSPGRPRTFIGIVAGEQLEFEEMQRNPLTIIRRNHRSFALHIKLSVITAQGTFTGRKLGSAAPSIPTVCFKLQQPCKSSVPPYLRCNPSFVTSWGQIETDVAPFSNICSLSVVQGRQWYQEQPSRRTRGVYTRATVDWYMARSTTCQCTRLVAYIPLLNAASLPRGIVFPCRDRKWDSSICQWESGSMQSGR